ncbi:SIR2 family histone deacetylase [Neurospora intermedia]|uniref:SIR2 family histone deacetylase n=1 Tax=Neurospora intermedia TaxID=5142 RepID=A0ABR3DPG3_NEUIN
MDCLRPKPSDSSSSGSLPSSPLSVLSQSPSLPPTPLLLDASNRYPSPSSSSIPSGSASPMKGPDSDLAQEIQVRTDGPPPTKRRRTAAPPRPRTTDRIDLENRVEEADENLDRLLTALRRKKKIVVIAGAGISVSAGIPDFRSSTGLFATLRGQHKLKASGKHLFDASVYKHDDSTESFHTMVRELAQLTSQAKPTPFHHMLASMAEEGRLLRLYTQNIDTLDTQMPPLATNVPLNAKGPWPVTVQLHGGLEKMVCTKCSHLEPFNAELFEGSEAPLCAKCKEQDEVRTTFAGKRSHGIGRLRPRIVLYNEYNPDEEAIGNVSKADLKRVPDAVIVVGTTLKIPGVRRLVKEMCQLTRSRRDGITAWINIDPEPQGAEFKDCWDYVIRGKCDDVAELVNLPRWDQQDIGDPTTWLVDENKEKRLEATLSKSRVDVLLQRKRKSPLSDDEDEKPLAKVLVQKQGGIPTPSASPKPRATLPARKSTTKTTAKQSILNFGKTTSSKEMTPVSAAITTGRKPLPGSAPQRKPRQTKKKEVVKPQNAINRTFKATKAVVAPGKENAKQIPFDPDTSSDLSSPPRDFDKDLPTVLPSLRPTAVKVPRPTMTTRSRSRTPSVGSSQSGAPGSGRDITLTISPKSKPRGIGHLID